MRLAAPAIRLGFVVEPGMARGKIDERRVERVIFQLTQGTNVVEEVKAAAKCGHRQIRLPLLDLQVAHRDGGKISFELYPLLAAVHREEQTKFRAHKQQVGIDRVFRECQHRAVIRQVAGDGIPGTPAIGALQQIRFEIAFLMILERGIHSTNVVTRGGDPAHISALRHAGKSSQLAPILPAIFGDLNQAIVAAHVQQPFLQRRFRDVGQVAIERSGSIFRDRIRAPHFTHHRQLVAIDLLGEVGTDGAPGIATIVAAKNLVGAEIKPGMRMRADQNRRIPIPAIDRKVFGFGRLDAGALTGATVITSERAFLILGINDVGIFRVDHRAEAIAALGDEPVGIGDAG